MCVYVPAQERSQASADRRSQPGLHLWSTSISASPSLLANKAQPWEAEPSWVPSQQPVCLQTLWTAATISIWTLDFIFVCVHEQLFTVHV